MTSIARPTVSPDVSNIVDNTKVASAASVKTPINDLAQATMVAQQYVAVSAADDNIKHLDDALTVSGGGIAKTIVNAGGDEKINFEVDNSENIWNASHFQGRPVGAGSPQPGDTWVWDGTYWLPSTLATGGGGGSGNVNGALPAPPVYHGGRLTLTAANTSVIPTSDVTAATTLYYRPYTGRFLSIFNTNLGDFEQVIIPDIIGTPAISLSGKTANTNYDVFAYKDTSTGILTLELLAWTNDTTRATAIDGPAYGAYLKNGDYSRRYLGTIRITGTPGQCEDSFLRRYVWNYHNRVARKLRVVDATASWTYNSATLRSANNSNNNRVGFLVGIQQEIVNFRAQLAYTSGGSGINVGVGLDSISVASEEIKGKQVTGGMYATCEYSGTPAEGYHYLQVLESCVAASTTTFGGMNAIGEVMA